jgi:hypothetical protein
VRQAPEQVGSKKPQKAPAHPALPLYIHVKAR